MIIRSMLLVRNYQTFTKSTTDTLIYLYLKHLTQEGKSSTEFLHGRFWGGFGNGEKQIGSEAELNTSLKYSVGDKRKRVVQQY